MEMETQKVMPMEMIKIINPKLKGKMSSVLWGIIHSSSCVICILREQLLNSISISRKLSSLVILMQETWQDASKWRAEIMYVLINIINLFFSLIYGFQVIQCLTISILVLGKQHFYLNLLI